MNELTEIEFQLPATQDDMATLFRQPDQVDALLGYIEQEVRSHAPDITSAKGRRAIASLASRVSRSKTALDGAGKELNAAARKQIDMVDAERRKIRDRLDALRDEARAPLTEWEQAEETRKAEYEAKVQAINVGMCTALSTSANVAERINAIREIQIDETWCEFEEPAARAKSTTLAQLSQLLESATTREGQEAELERLRAEAAEREAKEAEERAAREAAERAKRDADEAAARAKREQAARAEAAEKARIDAEQRAAREAAAAEARYKAEIEAAARRAEDAAARERERIVAERKAEEAATELRAANVRARAKMKATIVSAIEALSDKSPDGIAVALMEGRIPSVTVNF